MTLESEIKNLADHVEAVDSTLGRVLQLVGELVRMAQPPRMVELPEPLDPELYGATRWRSPGYIQGLPVKPRDDPPSPGLDASIAFLNGQWKRRDGHNVQTDLPPGGGVKASSNQQLDPWARRSPPAVDVGGEQYGEATNTRD